MRFNRSNRHDRSHRGWGIRPILSALRSAIGVDSGREHVGLEERVVEYAPKAEGTPADRIHGQDNYNHAEVTAALGKARYCDPRVDYPRIIGTSDREELRNLGHELKDGNPMLAADIFTYTRDAEGIKEMKKRLFNSTNQKELSYAFYWAQELGSAVLKEYCETLLKNASDPSRAFGISEMLGDVRLARAAHIQLSRVDSEAVEDLRNRYDDLKKTPTPSKAVKAVGMEKLETTTDVS